MFNLPDAQLCDFAVTCKSCGESIPAPVETMPDTWIIVPSVTPGAVICQQTSSGADCRAS